jgi:hypothetical protein
MKLHKIWFNTLQDKYTNNYVFKTLSEIVSTTGAIDWTDKFQNVVSEKYIW